MRDDKYEAYGDDGLLPSSYDPVAVVQSHLSLNETSYFRAEFAVSRTRC